MNGIFDSHAHYDDERFDADRDELLDALQEIGLSLRHRRDSEER